MAYNKEEYIRQAELQRQELNKTVLETAETFRDNTERLVEAIEFQSRFYRYSFGNSILIQSQNPEAEFCNSFKSFKDMGYSIRKGEHGMKILVPVYKKFIEVAPDRWLALSDASKEQKENYKQGKYKIHEKLYFKVGTVFDIKQTSCPKSDYPKIFDLGYTSEQHKFLFEKLKDFSKERLSCPVYEEGFSSLQTRGYYDRVKNDIHISSMFDDTTKLSILSHEIGHAMLHNVSQDFKAPVSQKEFEADAVSIMLHKRFGIDIAESRKSHISNHYKALMDSGYTSEQILKSLNRANDAYKRIMDGIEGESPQIVQEQNPAQTVTVALPNQVSGMNGMIQSM